MTPSPTCLDVQEAANASTAWRRRRQRGEEEEKEGGGEEEEGGRKWGRNGEEGRKRVEGEEE